MHSKSNVLVFAAAAIPVINKLSSTNCLILKATKTKEKIRMDQVWKKTNVYTNKSSNNSTNTSLQINTEMLSICKKFSTKF